MKKENPYEALDLDASIDLRTLTELLRERAEGLPPEERAVIQGYWQALTLNEEKRREYALESRPRGAAPKAPARLLQGVRLPPPLEERWEDLIDHLTPLGLLPPPSFEGKSES